jgi:cell division protein FtsB
MPRVRITSAHAGRRIALLGLITGLLVGYVEPLQECAAQKSALADQQQRLDTLIERRDALRVEIRDINTPTVLERRARDLGLVRLGERPYVIRGDFE